ncbi:elongation factor P maturation arginine rhamnosyltransferase EarP [Conchiformibius kuhniae]|uniref:Protein-arginine rhamnosyltransferase n=1 Tax=Conchiformibius kuhniae TaxID=211502 RepID=A0A8T9MS54_9NEIS|nr:elongation factor P maturation arginine rhamnosyltransferase EarP [Conchiformibius kuhniae]UOP04101.1 elongation factor P maturation arginine rhamnosyltransferase EarP [Conchiformibius kuhniae]
MKTKCWLFCTVIDNFGDIGVSWRLARELTQRLGWSVYLWVDDAAALRAIVPSLPEVLPLHHDGIYLRHWQEGQYADLSHVPPPDIAIEAFACRLPEQVQNIIIDNNAVCLNWEYLSAEDWALRTHLMKSLQANHLQKYFWQMGFLPESGGLLREADYAVRQKSFDHADEFNLRRQLGLPDRSRDCTDIFIFGYKTPVLQTWWRTLAKSGRHTRLWLAGEPSAESLRHNGVLPDNCHLLPFVAQADFDKILWSADILLIRGEDSFVRAQLAGKPMLWHIYPQAESAHTAKLNAFWQHYYPTAALPAKLQSAHHVLSAELNGGRRLNDTVRTQAWHTLLDHQSAWQQSARQWQHFLFGQSDAVSRLAQWYASTHRAAHKAPPYALP